MRPVYIAVPMLVMLLNGCVVNKTSSLNMVSDCVDTGSIDTCVLKHIDQNLKKITDDVAWISSAVEYSFALRTYDRGDKSISILDNALKRAANIQSHKKKTNALYEIAGALIDSKDTTRAKEAISVGIFSARQIDDTETSTDGLAKFSVLLIKVGDVETGMNQLHSLSQHSENLAAYKARAFKDVSIYLAEKKQFDMAIDVIEAVDYGLTYYQSTARIELARLANGFGMQEVANDLLRDAENIARAQSDGYFIAGALRDNAKARFLQAQNERALELFNDARSAAQLARTPQHRARAISRIATTLADIGMYDQARELFPEALQLLKSEASEQMRNYSLYEITGSAAFAGDFATAFANLDSIPDEGFGSAQSLRNAARRDVAWGLTRHGRVREALDLSNKVQTPRENVQLLSRVLRLLKQPDMPAFSRYL